MSGLQKQMQKRNLGSRLPSGLPPMPPSGVPGGRRHGPAVGGGLRRKRDFTPTPWQEYFETCEDVKVDECNIFRVYKSGHEGPVLLFLHGGGHSGLSWAVLSSIVSKLVKCRIVAIDLRGHGDTKTANEEDLSAETLSSDIGNVISSLYGDEAAPPIIMVGHSMGGAIAIHAGVKNLIPSLIGLIVIDVVEGTALDALQSMQSFLRGRPKQFKSLEYAIEWAVKSGQIRNIESAKVSMIGQLKRLQGLEALSLESCTPSFSAHEDVIREEPDEGQSADSTNSLEIESFVPYTWRVNLSKTEKFWKGWFQGMSNLFLSNIVPKMLVLAGVDRLDRDLTIGQMQGKFQMQVLPQCGHAVHEDQPKMVADALATFMLRHRFTEALSDFERPFPSC
ncbi:protein phosphatase methylesterase 1-like [Amphiura filiformis]|uniref:protein phosphatase methylesterase 1-like n=1 Tax=Amphiura filiformis TaxID=82378 RepID=UPI003B20E1CB